MGSDQSCNPKQAALQLIDTAKIMTAFGKPAIRVTVQNMGNVPGYNVVVDVHAKNAQGRIIDTGHAFPAYLSDLPPGGTAQDDAVFFKLGSHDDYVTLQYALHWLTRR